MTTPIRLELPTGFQFGTVNAFLFTDSKPVLVDTGLKSEASWTALQTGLAQYGLTVADLDQVIITHPHVDHCGQARRITEQSQAQFWIADLGQPWLLDLPAHFQQRADYYQQIYLPRWAFSPASTELILKQLTTLVEMCEAVPEERVKTFRIGDSLEMGGMFWQVLHAPGHASSQTCFYQADNRQLLAADMLLAKAPAPVLERPTSSGPSGQPPALAQFLESLTMIEALEIDQVYPGHGEPFGDHRTVIRRQRERIRQRLEECLGLIEAGHRTVAALMVKMYPNQLHLIGLWMLVGYLNLLEAEARVEVQVKGKEWHYFSETEDRKTGE